MCHAGGVSYSSVVWLPNAIILTALLGLVAFWRWRRAGALVGIRWVGIALLPLALYAIGLYRLVWTVGLAFSRFVTGFVFRPSVWLGLLLLVVAAVLILVPTRMRRARKASGAPASASLASAPRRAGLLGGTGRSSAKTAAAPADDDMAEIQDILNRHGLG